MIAGSGLVEARRENIPIGVNIPGVVTEVFVKKGENGQGGRPALPDRRPRVQVELEVREAELAAAQAQLHKLMVGAAARRHPARPGGREEAKARMNDAEAAMARTERLFERKMIPASDYDKDRYAFFAAKATYARAKADLEKIMAGTWKEDIEIARAAVQLAESQVESIKINLERLIVRAPMDGEILQLNVRLGQFAALAWKEPMIVLGDIKRLHVRVDHRRERPAYFSKGRGPSPRSRAGPTSVSVEFVYVEPYVIPKQSLTGNNSERVDHARPPGHLRAARRTSGRRLRRPADGRLPQGGPAVVVHCARLGRR